jgi:hypothetical protein
MAATTAMWLEEREEGRGSSVQGRSRGREEAGQSKNLAQASEDNAETGKAWSRRRDFCLRSDLQQITPRDEAVRRTTSRSCKRVG